MGRRNKSDDDKFENESARLCVRDYCDVVQRKLAGLLRNNPQEACGSIILYMLDDFFMDHFQSSLLNEPLVCLRIEMAEEHWDSKPIIFNCVISCASTQAGNKYSSGP